VRVEFDPDITSFRDLLDKIFKKVKPFSFCESRECKQYQHGIWWVQEEQRVEIMEKVSQIEKREENLNRHSPRKVRMEISRAREFYKAEEYHQDNYNKAMQMFPPIESPDNNHGNKLGKEKLKNEL